MDKMMPKIELLPVDTIELSQKNQREVCMDTVNFIADSILRVGLENPITVHRNDKIHLVAGLHRLCAMVKLGYTEIPCKVYENRNDDLSIEYIELIENLARNNGTVLERSRSWARLNEIGIAKGWFSKNGGDKTKQKAESQKEILPLTKKIASSTNRCHQQISKEKRIGEKLELTKPYSKDIETKIKSQRIDNSLTALYTLIGTKKDDWDLDTYNTILDLASEILEKEKQENTIVSKPEVAVKKAVKQFKRASLLLDNPYEEPQIEGDFKVNTINKCDIFDLYDRLPENSVDMIFTDPPYHEKYLPMYEQVALVASKVLKEGGYCFTYSTLTYFDQIMSRMTQHLDYCWIVSLSMPFGNELIRKTGFWSKWRPLLCLRKKGNDVTRVDNALDHLVTKKQKGNHEWQQDIEAPQEIISKFCPVNGIVLDPCIGGGTTIKIAMQNNRNFIGFDIDDYALSVTQQLINTNNIREENNG